MEKEINTEYEKFNIIYQGLNKELITLMLTDIVGVLTKRDNGKNDYKAFDDLVESIKDLLDSIDVEMPKMDLQGLIKNLEYNIDSVKRMSDECSYSLRTLAWIKDLLQEGENNNEEIRDN